MAIRNSYELGSAVGGLLGGIVGGVVGGIAGAASEFIDDLDVITDDICRGGTMTEREYHIRKARRELEKARECKCDFCGYYEMETHKSMPGGYMHTRVTRRW